MSPKHPGRRVESSHVDLVQDAWSSMFGFVMVTSDERSRRIAELGLTPTDARTLATLAAQPESAPMAALAERWGCDPSTASWAVGRLEDRGLVERTVSERDRRVRLVALTANGRRLHRRLESAVQRPPAALRELKDSDLNELIQIMQRLLAAHDALKQSGG